MAYFLKTNEFGVFVAPGLAPYIHKGSTVNKDDIFIVRFNFLGQEHKVLVDKQYVTDHAITNNEVFDLEETGKEDVYFDLVPVPGSLFVQFVKLNNIEM